MLRSEVLPSQSHRRRDQFDAVLHFDETRAVEPLEVTAEWEAGVPPVPTIAISPILPASRRLGRLRQTTGGFRWIDQD